MQYDDQRKNDPFFKGSFLLSAHCYVFKTVATF